MPTRNVNLTPEMDHYVDAQIQSGKYANASEVIRAGLRALEEAVREETAKLTALREAILAGEASGIADDDVCERILEELRQRGAAIGEDRKFG